MKVLAVKTKEVSHLPEVFLKTWFTQVTAFSPSRSENFEFQQAHQFYMLEKR